MIISRRRVLSDVGLPMSVVFANKTNNSLTIVEGDEWNVTSYPPSTFVPIGVVVIPREHGVLKATNGTNQCGIISIVPMNCDTPTNGGTSETNAMCWGESSTNPTGKFFQRVVITPSNTSNTANGLSDDYETYMPRQGNVFGIPTRTSSPYSPSPYIGSDYKSGGYNTSYGTTSFDTSINKNALADFDGVMNTRKIIIQRGTKSYTSWKPRYNAEEDYPPASCCDMYYTVGTKQGDWYLPAMGELGYIAPKLYDINETISRLNSIYGVGVQLLTNDRYWSSTEHRESTDAARRLNTSNGLVGYNYKTNNSYTRAFLRL